MKARKNKEVKDINYNVFPLHEEWKKTGKGYKYEYYFLRFFQSCLEKKGVELELEEIEAVLNCEEVDWCVSKFIYEKFPDYNHG